MRFLLYVFLKKSWNSNVPTNCRTIPLWVFWMMADWIIRHCTIWMTTPVIPGVPAGFILPRQVKNILYETKKNLRYIAIHFNMELYPGLDVFLNCPEVIFEYAPELVLKMQDTFRITDPYCRTSCYREICLNFCNRHHGPRPSMLYNPKWMNMP